MHVRKATIDDIPDLIHLYREVARVSQGIARTETEVTEAYLNGLYQQVTQQGLMLVGVNPITNELIAEMHASKYGLHIFNHILTNVTIVVKPAYQGQGIGKALFETFLREVDDHWPEVGRIELESRSSNQKSIGLYQSLGFVQEGRMSHKTRNSNGVYEDSLLFARIKPGFHFS